jgi:hypothetical protein
MANGIFYEPLCRDGVCGVVILAAGILHRSLRRKVAVVSVVVLACFLLPHTRTALRYGFRTPEISLPDLPADPSAPLVIADPLRFMQRESGPTARAITIRRPLVSAASYRRVFRVHTGACGIYVRVWRQNYFRMAAEESDGRRPHGHDGSFALLFYVPSKALTASSYRMAENGSGCKITLLMLATISGSVRPCVVRSFFHSGSAPKSCHKRSRAARSS